MVDRILYTEFITMSKQLSPLAPGIDLVDQVYRRLIDAIVSGHLAPGQRVTQEDLASQLAVSRQPVLQAMRLLKKESLLLDAPGRGVLVAPLDVQRVAQAYEVRQALDGLAAGLAAQRRATLPQALFETGRAAVASRSIPAMIEADWAFHMALYEASGNPMIADSAALHWPHLHRAMGQVLQSGSLADGVWDEHQAMAEAIAAGDVTRAQALILQHTQQARDHLTGRLNQVLQPQATEPVP